MQESAGTLLLGDPDRVRLPAMVGDNVRRDDNEQFVVFLHFCIVGQTLTQTGKGLKSGNSAHGILIVGGDFAGNDSGLAIAKAYAALIFLVGDYWHAVRTASGQ